MRKLFSLLFIILLIFPIVSAISWGGGRTTVINQTIIEGNINANFSNYTDIWITNEGYMDNLTDLLPWADTQYLRLDASNDPLTDDLNITGNLYVEGLGEFQYSESDQSKSSDSIFSFTSTHDDTNYSGTLDVMKFSPTVTGDSEINRLFNFYLRSQLRSDKDITTTAGFVTEPYIEVGSGNITNLYSFWARGGTYGSGSTASVGDYIGFRIDDIHGDTPVTNDYGIYIEDIDEGTSTNYALYTNDGDVRLGDDISIASNKFISWGTYAHQRTGAGHNMYFDYGGEAYWRDRDGGYATTIEFDSSTGNIISQGTITADYFSGDGHLITNISVAANASLEFFNHFNYTAAFNASHTPEHNESTITTGCVGNWWLENNATDGSGAGNDGNINGSVNITGWIGDAYFFDGVDDNIDFTDNGFPGGTANRTFAAWVKSDPEGAYATIFSYGTDTTYDRYTIKIWNDVPPYTTGVVVVDTHTGSLGGITAIDDNQWHHVVAVVDGTNTHRIYVDGELDASGSITPTTTTKTGTGWIGANSGTKHYFNGTIDEVLFFNRSMDADEVKALYNSQANFSASAAVVYSNRNLTMKDNSITNVSRIEVETVNATYLQGDGHLITNISPDAVDSAWNRSGTNVFLRYPGDNVGIGTSSPIHNLDINGTARIVSGADTGLKIGVTGNQFNFGLEQNNQASSYRTKVAFGNDTDSWQWQMGTDSGINKNDDFWIWGRNSGFALIIDDNSYVKANKRLGIATTPDLASLQVEVDGNNFNTMYTQADTSAMYRAKFGFHTDADDFQWQMGVDSAINKTNDFWIWNRGYGDFIMTLTDGGNVGIGTTDPDEQLTVSGGSIQVESGYRVELNQSNNPPYIYSANGHIYANTGSDWALTLHNSGKAMFGPGPGGLLVPTQELDVNGNLNVTGDEYIEGTAYMGWERVSNSGVGVSNIEVNCTSGKKVLGGGCQTAGVGVLVESSFPQDDDTWECEYSSASTNTAYAICARMDA
jgi:hypothetical protein